MLITTRASERPAGCRRQRRKPEQAAIPSEAAPNHEAEMSEFVELREFGLRRNALSSQTARAGPSPRRSLDTFFSTPAI